MRTNMPEGEAKCRNFLSLEVASTELQWKSLATPNKYMFYILIIWIKFKQPKLRNQLE